MMKFVTKFLNISLIIIPVVSIINLITYGWTLISIYMGAYVAWWLAFGGLLTNHYLILISILIYTLLFLTAFSVRKRHVVLPILSCLYFAFDFVMVARSMLELPYLEEDVPSIIISITMVVFLCIYCYKCIREKIHNRKKSKEPPAITAQLDEPGT